MTLFPVHFRYSTRSSNSVRRLTSKLVTQCHHSLFGHLIANTLFSKCPFSQIDLKLWPLSTYWPLWPTTLTLTIFRQKTSGLLICNKHMKIYILSLPSRFPQQPNCIRNRKRVCTEQNFENAPNYMNVWSTEHFDPSKQINESLEDTLVCVFMEMNTKDLRYNSKGWPESYIQRYFETSSACVIQKLI